MGVMTKEEFKAKLDEASRIVESWPDWKKYQLRDSFRSKNSKPRPAVEYPPSPEKDSK